MNWTGGGGVGRVSCRYHTSFVHTVASTTLTGFSLPPKISRRFPDTSVAEWENSGGASRGWECGVTTEEDDPDKVGPADGAPDVDVAAVAVLPEERERLR